MRRMERRMYRQRRGQAWVRGLLLGIAGIVVLAGLISRLRGGRELIAQPIAQPTATPIASAFDETVETREISLPGETWYAIQTGVFSSREAAEALAKAARAEVVQVIGTKFVLYRPSHRKEKKDKILLVENRMK